MIEVIRSRFQGALESPVLIEVSVLTFREDPLLRRSHEDLGDGIERKQEERFEGGQSVAEIHEGRDEDQDVEDNGSHIAQRHLGDGMDDNAQSRLRGVVCCCRRHCLWPANGMVNRTGLIIRIRPDVTCGTQEL